MFFRILTVTGAAVLTFTATVALAVPMTLQVQGALQASGGGAAADGAYVLNISIYKEETGGKALWSEGPLLATVKSGLFAVVLGEKALLTADVVAQLGGTAWLGVKVEPDPELPRVQVRSTLYAMRAGAAESLDCSGCVTGAMIDAKVFAPFAKVADLAKIATSGAYADLANKPDLAVYAKSAGLAKVATSGSYMDLQGNPDLNEYVKAASLAKVAGSGEYADLKNQPDLAVYAKAAGLADVAKTGAYGDLTGKPVLAQVGAACGTGLVVRGLKADGSLDCLAVQLKLQPDDLAVVSNGLLTDTFNDAYPSGAAVAIKDQNPDGITDEISLPDVGLAQGVAVTVDLANSDISAVEVKLLDPNGDSYTLYSKSGKKGEALKASYPPTALVKGDLTTWNGKNPKGKWKLTVVDSAFLNNTTDGQLNSWSIAVKTLSTKKVAALGGLQLHNTDIPPVACNKFNAGTMYYGNKDSTIYVCNGTQYFPISLTYWGTQANPAITCKDLLTKLPATQSGTYWIDPDGLGGLDPFPATCDMTTLGGGWTRIEETTDYAYKIYTEGVGEQPYKYSLSDAQIDAIKAKSSEARQGWACHTVGVGSAYDLRFWPKNLVDTYAACWATNNADEKTASGTETTFANIPQRSWLSEDCGDANEACQHNVDHAWLR